MKRMLLAIMAFGLLGSSVAFAGTGAFAYPNANGVIVAGLPGVDIKICYYEDEVFDLNLPADAQTIVPVWECDYVQGYGAKGPVWYFFKHTSPVRISNARWAYALKKQHRHSGRSDHDVVREAVTTVNAEERRGGYVKRGNHNHHTLGFDALVIERFEN